MNRPTRGFLLVELAVAVAVFAGVTLMVVVFLTTACDVLAVGNERIVAAGKANEILDDVRAGQIGVVEGRACEVTLPGEDVKLPRPTCTVEVQPWPTQSKLARVTVTVSWHHAQNAKASVTLETLVQRSRLKVTKAGGAAPSKQDAGERGR